MRDEEELRIEYVKELNEIEEEMSHLIAGEKEFSEEFDNFETRQTQLLEFLGELE